MLIHIATIYPFQQPKQQILLRRLDPLRYVWFIKKDNGEEQTDIWGATSEEAILTARHYWKEALFTTLNCGFRYTLPERDEHGSNALFHQMVASYNSMNGVYFDEELGCNCFVQNASLEARELSKILS